ncbi:MAG: hypothetical protein L0Y64_00785 [Myxococcaceae bacterium]|nr:hypothetical protein [Myxococcaceae bacterium]
MGAWNQMHDDEVREHTLPTVNRRIDEHVEHGVAQLLEKDDSSLLSQRIVALEDGWDCERTFDAVTGALALVGVAAAKRWGGAFWLLPAAAGFLLVEQALTGGSSLIRVLRELGIRTRRELDLEKFALKGLRGDFTRIPHEGGPELRANAALVASQS